MRFRTKGRRTAPLPRRKKGRITVTSNFQSDKEPGGCAVTCEEPVDLSHFEITFSLDQYTKCADQYLAIGFSSAPNTTSLYADTEHPRLYAAAAAHR